MKSPRAPLFLERDTYRRRRLMDAARILPVVGFVLILLPVLWSRDHAGERGITTAGEALYLFILWLVLVLAAALIAGPLRRALHPDLGGEPPAEPQPDTPTSDEAPSQAPGP